jgi:hypothetical protein
MFGLSLVLGGFTGGRAYVAERSGAALIPSHRSNLTIPSGEWAYLFAADPDGGVAQGLDKRPKSLRAPGAALAGSLALATFALFVLLLHRPVSAPHPSVAAWRRPPRAPPLVLPS